jgi:hypothetical protein
MLISRPQLLGVVAERVLALAAEATEHFLMIVPHRVQADPNISTE